MPTLISLIPAFASGIAVSIAALQLLFVGDLTWLAFCAVAIPFLGGVFSGYAARRAKLKTEVWPFVSATVFGAFAGAVGHSGFQYFVVGNDDGLFWPVTTVLSIPIILLSVVAGVLSAAGYEIGRGI